MLPRYPVLQLCHLPGELPQASAVCEMWPAILQPSPGEMDPAQKGELGALLQQAAFRLSFSSCRVGEGTDQHAQSEWGLGVVTTWTVETLHFIDSPI